MPKASIDLEPTKFPLETLKGGWVTLRPLSYPETQHRREIATRTSFYQNPTGTDDGTPTKVELDLLVQTTSEFDLAHCVVDHNLYRDDAETDKYNFATPEGYHDLRTDIGAEIEVLIAKLNEGGDLKDSKTPSQSLPVATSTQPNSKPLASV